MNASSSKTTSEWLTQATKRLGLAGIGTAQLDALVLLEDASGKDRAYLLSHPEYVVKGPTLSKLEGWVERRSRHIPLAQIRHKTEFYGREFYIDERVLEPRPESETMIELLHQLITHSDKFGESRVLDVGTGSGALAITIALEFPSVQVQGTDIDLGCLEVAQHNAEALVASVNFFQADLLDSISDSYSFILANLPYVPDSYQLNEAALNEPKTAIFGGPDGLNLYRRLFAQAQRLQPAYIFTESLPFQHLQLAKLAQQHDYALDQTDDFIQLFTHHRS